MKQPSAPKPNEHSDQSKAVTPDRYRNPRARRNAPERPEDHDRPTQVDPELDYEKPDGTEPMRGLGGA